MDAEVLSFNEARKNRSVTDLKKIVTQLEYLPDTNNKSTLVFRDAIVFFIKEQTFFCGEDVAYSQVGKILSTDKEEVKNWHTKKVDAFLKLIPLDERPGAIKDLADYLEKGDV